jgi:galactosamine-6-phosphate isomerase
MNISFHPGYRAMSEAAAALVCDSLLTKPESLLCLATGGSPKGVYEHLGRQQALCRRLRGMALDEWHGLDRDHPSTCRAYLQRHVFGPWGVGPAQQDVFDASAADPRAECRRMAIRLNDTGPFDLCILGLGRNGHLGLNEPGVALQPHAHVAELAEHSQAHAMLVAAGARIKRGMTFGMADLLAARAIVMLVCGSEKEHAAHALFSGEVSTDCPATFLNLHPNAYVFVDTTAVRQDARPSSSKSIRSTP